MLCKHSLSQPKTSFSCLSVLWRSPAPFSIHLLIKLLLNSKEQSKSAENLKEDPIIGAGVAVLSVLIRSVEDGDLRDTEDDRFTVPNAGELLLMGVLSRSFTSVSLGFNAKPLKSIVGFLSIFQKVQHEAV